MPSDESKGSQLDAIGSLAQRQLDNTDRKHPADRLNPVIFTVRVHEQHIHLGRRSSSAWAKNADALRRISFARFSSRFSRSSSFSR